MKLFFWGVRGSVPTPLTPDQLRRKIAAVVQRIHPDDLKSSETREHFLANLPKSLFGTIGGNTACLELTSSAGQQLIIDAGSGIRELGLKLARKLSRPATYHILMTHFHWDHIQGLPFFYPLLKKGNKIFFYSPVRDFDRILKEQMRPPYFPITMDIAASTIKFVHLKKQRFSLGDFSIMMKNMQHPGGSVSYRCSADGKSIIFATDTEIDSPQFVRNTENNLFYNDTDIIILDAQYTLREYIDKTNWGHTSQNMAVDLAMAWKIKKLFFFHHEPIYSDNQIYRMRKSAEYYNNFLKRQNVEIHIAREGQEVLL